jgi:hypothetical protein
MNYCTAHNLPTTSTTGACTVTRVPAPARDDLADRLLFVLDGWTSKDDWGVETYPYPGTVRHLLDCLKAGDDPRALRLIGNVAPCEGRRYTVLISRVPRYAADEARDMAIMRSPAPRS